MKAHSKQGVLHIHKYVTRPHIFIFHFYHFPLLPFLPTSIYSSQTHYFYLVLPVCTQCGSIYWELKDVSRLPPHNSCQ